jgi:hypothetical protein
MRCEYAGCKREAVEFSDELFLCEKHKRLADRCYYFQSGGILGGIAGFFGF